MKRLIQMTTIMALAVALSSCSESPADKQARLLKQAHEAFAQEKYQDAISDYRGVLGIDPGNAAAIQKLGLALYQEGRLAEAFPFLLKTKELAPDNVEARMALATIYIWGGKRTEASEEARFVVRRHPENVDALMVLLGIARGEKLVLAIAERLAEVRDKFPHNGRASLALGAAYLRAGAETKAESSFRESIERAPNAMAGHAALGQLYLKQGKSEAAAEQFKAAAAVAPAGLRARLALADFYQLTGQPKLARQALQELLEEAPSLSAHRRMVRMNLGERKFAEARSTIASILGKDPKDLSGQFFQGQLDLLEGRTEQAIQQFLAILQADPGLPQVRLSLALAYLQSGQTEQAKQQLTEVVAAFKGFSAGNVALAELHLQAGEGQRSVAILQDVVKERPQDRRVQFLLGRAYIVANEPLKALKIFEPALKAAPKDPRLRYFYGLALLQNGDSAKAKKEFERALELSPSYLNPLATLVQLAVRDKKPEEALRLVQRQVERVPKSAPLYRQLGALLRVQGQEQEAEEAFKKALELDPKMLATHLALANLYLDSARQKDALVHLRKGLEIDPKSVRALLLIGMIHQVEGDTDKARESYEAALAINERFGPAANNLAHIYMEEGKDLDKALSLAQTAKEVMPEDPQAADTLGWVLYRRGIYNQALGYIKEGAQKMPDNAEIQYHLGMTYYKLGRNAEAKTALANALKSDSQFAGVDEAKATLSELEGGSG